MCSAGAWPAGGRSCVLRARFDARNAASVLPLPTTTAQAAVRTGVGFKFMLLPKPVGSRRASAFPAVRVARKRAGLPALRPDYTAGGPEGGRRPICLRAAGVSEHHESQGNAAVDGPLRPQFSIFFDRAWSG